MSNKFLLEEGEKSLRMLHAVSQMMSIELIQSYGTVYCSSAKLLSPANANSVQQRIFNTMPSELQRFDCAERKLIRRAAITFIMSTFNTKQLLRNTENQISNCKKAIANLKGNFTLAEDINDMINELNSKQERLRLECKLLAYDSFRYDMMRLYSNYDEFITNVVPNLEKGYHQLRGTKPTPESTQMPLSKGFTVTLRSGAKKNDASVVVEMEISESTSVLSLGDYQSE